VWLVHTEGVISSKVNVSDERSDRSTDSDEIEGGEIQASIHVVFSQNRASITMRSVTALSLNINSPVQRTCVYIPDVV
jgi:hypothetical protein